MRLATIVALGAAAITGSFPAVAQQSITISSWGGAFQKAQRQAWFELVEKELNIRIKEETTSGIGDVRAQSSALLVGADQRIASPLVSGGEAILQLLGAEAAAAV